MIKIDNTKSNSFLAGFSNTFEAFPFIFRNRMAKFLILPLLVNITLLILITWLAYAKINPLLQSVVQFEQWYLKPLEYLVSPLLAIMLVTASFFAYSVTGTLIASPFLDIISLKTESALGTEVPDPGFSLKAAWRMATGTIKLLVLMVLIYIVILPLNLVPVAGTAVYAAAGFLITAFFCGFQFYDMPLERREFSFDEKILICRKFAATVTGTGAAFMLLSLIPVAGFLAIVVASSGAAISYTRVMGPAIHSSNQK